MNMLVTKAFSCTDEQLEILKEYGYEITVFEDERETVSNPEKYDTVICNGLFLYNDIKAFTSLKTIQLTSAGFDRVPVDYCAEHGIKVFNAKGVYSVPMAEWCVLQILNSYKPLSFFGNNKKEKKWVKNRNLIELYGKTACIVGFGSVGTEIAKRLKAFDVKIISVDITDANSHLSDEFYYFDEIKTALEKSDIVVLTLPLTESTRKMFNGDLFSVMKDNTVLVNISRGAVIDEQALTEFIKKGKFLSVCLDVFETEPLSETSQLWDFENVFISPHNSFVGENNNKRLFDVIQKNLREISK